MLNVGTYLADRYEIISKVGAGGMSDVYKAMDHILGRYVAIKVLKMEFSDDRTFVTKFRTEAQSAAGLEHPNIVNIYDVGSEEGLHYIVMEYVEGITLKTYIEKKVQLSFKEAISIAIQVARGIEVAHNKNIVHRDIKPQNIIISTEGKVKVTDFGIARAASANTISSDVMGSVHYASPEQARNGYVDNRSDIYSLGIVMYEMVTGRVPFDGETTVAVALQHLQEPFPDPSVYAPDVPISLKKIILKCTQKTPDKRYQSMEELLADLRKALVNPNEDFVVIPDLSDAGKTKVMSAEDMAQIKSGVIASVEEDSETEKTTRMVKPDRRLSLFDDDEEDEEDTKKGDEDDDEDDDEEGGLNPKMDKVVTIVGIVVAVIIVIVIFFFILSLFGTFKHKSDTDSTETASEVVMTVDADSADETVEMINLVGMSQEEASKALDKLGLSIFVKTTESDEEAGTVLSQDIEEGQTVKKGSTVTVVVAEAEEMVEIPSVVNTDESEAVKALEALKLEVERTYDYSDEVDSGKVVSQNPSAGSKAEPGSKVTLVISQGAETVKVPVVTGKSSQDAQTTLANNGLNVMIEEAYSDKVDSGYVISQEPSSGSTVNKYSNVKIVVSKGKEQKTTYYKTSVSVKYTETDEKKFDHATVTVKGDSGTTLYNHDVTSNDTTVSIDEMTEAHGTVTVTYYYKDADGVTHEDESASGTNPVSFDAYTKQ